MRIAGAAAAAAVAASALCVGCGSSGGSSSASRATTSAASSSAPSTVAATPPRRRVGPPPGSLPQTHQLPSSSSPTFKAQMGELFSAVQSGSAKSGLGAFFPLRAYEQVKAIASPASDFKQRLLGSYSLDIAAAHQLLGAHVREAKLLAVHVPGAFVHWVDPGTCVNRVGYYEVPNSRMVYRESGQVRSFGIASMISWRGVWYVVHLGAVTRPGAGGVVDEPNTGAGSPTPSSTC